MGVPQYSDKVRFAPLISAKKTLQHLKSCGKIPEGPPPKKVVLCYQSSFFERIAATRKGKFSSGAFRKIFWLDEAPGVAVGEFGIGSPQIANKVELLIAWGVEEFISIGTAGAIASDLNPGDLVGCTKALRDEGTSHHYLPDGRYSYPTDGGAFAARFERTGPSWTIDAFYCHTKEEIASYQQEGILTVEMEASALFALAEVRRVSMAAGFVISDLLYGSEWMPSLYLPEVERGLDLLLEMAIH